MYEKLPWNRELALAAGALILAGLLPIAATLYAAGNRLKPEQSVEVQYPDNFKP